jgi:hypothetical protein
MNSVITTKRFRVFTDPGNEPEYLCSVEKIKQKDSIYGN